MKDQLAAAKNILLLSDDQHACAEIADLLTQSTLEISQISSKVLSPGFSKNIEGLDYDVAVISITEPDKFDNDIVEKLTRFGIFNSPVLFISDSEVKSTALQSLRDKCGDFFLREHITLVLLACSINHLITNSRLQNNLHKTEIRHAAVLSAVTEGVITCNAAGDIQSINSAAEQILGIQSVETSGKSLTEFLASEFQSELEQFFQNSLTLNKGALSPFKAEVNGVRGNRSQFPMELKISGTSLSECREFTCIVRDITADKQKEEEFQLAATAFETHTAILITSVTGTILRVNPAFTQITGYTEEEAVGGNPKMLQSGHHGKEFYDKFWHSVKTIGKWEGEIWNKRKNGEIFPEWQTITAVKNNAGEVTHYVATFQDITERKQTQALIEHHAFYDALTNLPNRRMMLDRLNQELSAARRHQIFGALLFLDLDHFKNLNDSMGHAVGDSLLQQMAKRLSNHVRAEDTVSRLGGDEFVVLLSNLGLDEKSATATANAIAKKIHRSISKPYLLEGHSFSFTSSIGITLFPYADDSADDVLKHADAAMYRAKARGRNAICFYQSSMQAEADQRLQLEKELRIAIDNDELVLYYQPQFSNEGGLVGAEALLRWSHPKRGIVEPKDFIPLAEEINLIQAMGAWVINTAVKQYVVWLENGLFSGIEYIAVNVSPKQIQQDDFVAIIGDALKESNIPPRSLKLELTESVLLNDLQDVVIKMNQLKGLGVSFSMDDFGTGFSSLSYLKRLPFDQIKIDKTFIRDVSRDINDAAIVETIIAMATHLKLDVIAEGVETEAEFEFLQDRGCNHYQGFYFSTPLQASSFEQTVRQLLNQDKTAASAN
jgi:diguanylate cyclase (GGDEF)-like protein/PAS domain S-box-containing protein